MKKHRKESKRWFDQSLEDLKSAKILHYNKRYYLVCFLSHQIVEKALKSVIYLNKEDLVLGHSINKLSNWAGEFDNSFKKLGQEVSIFDTYYIPTRYPNGLPDGIPAEVFNKNIAQNALNLVKKSIKVVRNYLILNFFRNI